MNFSHMMTRIREERRPLRFLLSRVLAATGLAARLKLKITRDGYQLHFFDTAMSQNLWLSAEDRSYDVDIIRSLLTPGGVYVDIGANIGDLVLAGASAVGPGGKVFAFEAHPRTFSLMLQNVALNGRPNIHPVNAACGDAFGWARFSNKSADDMNQVGTGDLVVPIVPAQSFLPQEQIDLVKVDVEGFELFVLQGLVDALPRTRHLLLEVGDAHFMHFGYRFADVYDLLVGLGFAILKQDGDGDARIWKPLNDRDHPFPRVQNVIATRDLRLRERLPG